MHCWSPNVAVSKTLAILYPAYTGSDVWLLFSSTVIGCITCLILRFGYLDTLGVWRSVTYCSVCRSKYINLISFWSHFDLILIPVANISIDEIRKWLSCFVWAIVESHVHIRECCVRLFLSLPPTSPILLSGDRGRMDSSHGCQFRSTRLAQGGTKPFHCWGNPPPPPHTHILTHILTHKRTCAHTFKCAFYKVGDLISWNI